MPTNRSNDRETREARERLRRYNARKTVHEQGRGRRRRDNIIAAIGAVAVIALVAGAQVYYFNGGPGTPDAAPTASATDTPADAATASPAPTDPAAAGSNVGEVPDPSVAEDRVWTGEMTLDDVTLAIQLDGTLAPQAVASFVASSRDGYYTGKTCHRLVSAPTAGLLQCGSLDGTGSTDPTYSFGPLENTPTDGIYSAGTIAMARAGDDAYSNGRQFFIVFADTTLPNDAAGGYTVFGTVTAGLEELKKQITDAGAVDGASDGAPVVPTTITGLTIK